LAFGDALELISRPEVDVVSVSVKVPDHYRLVRAALETGKPVMCEWPLGVDTAQATELADLAGALNESRPATPEFGAAVRFHQLVEAVQRASDTGIRQTLS
jgi:hypothetical protein